MRPPLVNLVAAIALVLIGWGVSEQPGTFEGISFQIIGYGLIAFAIVVMLIVAGRYKNFGSALAFAWKPTQTVVNLLKSWKPQNCRTHKQYQKSLDEHLAKKFPDIKITQESGSSRVRADLEVGKEVVIELKTDLNSTSKLQQLIGQIELYKREFRGRDILVVLVGDTERNTFQNLEDAIGSQVRVRIITK